MPLLPVSVAPRIAPAARSASTPLGVIVALSVVSLLVVAAGFLLVALTLVDWIGLSPLWGLGLSVAGLALALVVRDRAPSVRS